MDWCILIKYKYVMQCDNISLKGIHCLNEYKTLT